MAGERLSADDRYAIHELLGRYCHALDGGSEREFVELFLDDGEWHGPGGSHVGRAQLQNMFDSYRKHPDVAGSRHWVAQTIIDDTSDPVRVTSYTLCVGPSPDGNEMIVELIGRYLDDVAKQDGQWMFKCRNVVDVYPVAVNDFELENEA
jgi:hypothetical protein